MDEKLNLGENEQVNEIYKDEKIIYHEHDVVPVEKDDEITVKKCKKRSEDFTFSYYDKRQYKEYKKRLEETNPEIEPEELGFFKLTKRFKDKGDNVIVIKDNKFDVKNKKRNIFRGVAGYVKVSTDKNDSESNSFIALTKPRIIIILLLLIGLLFVGLGSCTHPNAPDNPIKDLIIDDGFDWNGEDPGGDQSQSVSTEYIEIPGYGEITLSDKNPEMYLINPTKNTVYMQYIIYKGNETVFQTNLIPPGKMIPWKGSNSLPKGTHELTVQINTFDLETKAGCNGATQNLKLIIS